MSSCPHESSQVWTVSDINCHNFVTERFSKCLPVASLSCECLLFSQFLRTDTHTHTHTIRSFAAGVIGLGMVYMIPFNIALKVNDYKVHTKTLLYA